MKLMIFIMGLALNMPTQSQTLTHNKVYVKQQQKEQLCKRVSKEAFKAKLMSLDNYQLIDVRTAGEFNKGTITGAKNIDFFATDFSEQIAKLNKSKPVLIFCQSGGRSAKALQQFKAMGFNYVLELEGGYGNWLR